MGPAAYKLLSESLPLHNFPVGTLPQDYVFHHFGEFDAVKHQLDRPIWVSDNFRFALERYSHVGPCYTKMKLRRHVVVTDLSGVDLKWFTEALHLPSKRAWDKCFADYLARYWVLAIKYSEDEIFLPRPALIIGSVESLFAPSLPFYPKHKVISW